MFLVPRQSPTAGGTLMAEFPLLPAFFILPNYYGVSQVIQAGVL